MSPDRKKIDKIYSKINKIAIKGKNSFLEYYGLIDESITNSEYNYFLQTLYNYYNINIEKLITVTDVKTKTFDKILLVTNSNLSIRIKNLYDKNKLYQTSFNIFSEDSRYLIPSLSDPLSSTFSNTGLTQSISIVENNGVFDINILNTNIFSIKLSKATWVTKDGIYQPTKRKLLYNLQGLTQSVLSSIIPINTAGSYLITTEERPNYKVLNYELNTNFDNYMGDIREIDDINEESKYYIKNKMYSKITQTRRNNLEVIKRGATQSVIFDYYNYDLSDDQNLYNKYIDAVNLLIS